MKTSSGPGSHDAPARQTAQGFLATNLVMPGLGSIVAGRKVGYLQLALCLGSFVLTLVFGVRFIFWSLAHWAEFHDPGAVADPLQPLRDLLSHAAWPVLGILLYGVAWLWALVTSRSLLAQSQTRPVPPRPGE